LGSKDTKAVLFTDGLLFVKSKVTEVWIKEPFPEFIHDVDEPSAVNDALHAVQQVHGQRCAYLRVVKKFGAVEAIQTVSGKIELIDGLSSTQENEPPSHHLASLFATDSSSVSMRFCRTVERRLSSCGIFMTVRTAALISCSSLVERCRPVP